VDTFNHKLPVRAITVKEARDRIPTIKKIQKQIYHKYQQFVLLTTEFETLNKDGTVDEISKMRYKLDVLEEKLSEYREELRLMDVLLKDYENVLVDMVTFRDSEAVLLCFKLGEEELKYYHSIDGGYMRRKPIDFD
jgi:hypothetical protein